MLQVKIHFIRTKEKQRGHIVLDWWLLGERRNFILLMIDAFTGQNDKSFNGPFFKILVNSKIWFAQAQGLQIHWLWFDQTYF